MSSCPSWSSGHFLSPLGEEFKNSCVGSAMLLTSGTWAPTSSDLHRLQHYDRTIIRWMCGVTTKDQVSSQELLKKMQLDLTREGSPHPSTHMLWPCRTWWWLSEGRPATHRIGGGGRGHSKKIWSELIRQDCLAHHHHHWTTWYLFESIGKEIKPFNTCIWQELSLLFKWLYNTIPLYYGICCKSVHTKTW